MNVMFVYSMAKAMSTMAAGRNADLPQGAPLTCSPMFDSLSKTSYRKVVIATLPPPPRKDGRIIRLAEYNARNNYAHRAHLLLSFAGTTLTCCFEPAQFLSQRNV